MPYNYLKRKVILKKRYKPAYNSHLYGVIPNDLFTHIKYVKNQSFQYSTFYKPNLSTFLSVIWLSQQPQYRNIYYTWCCFLTRFTTIYYKPYVEYLMGGQIETKLSIYNQQICLFKFLESYYYTVPHFQTFKSDYFFYDNYDYPYLLPYKNYIFKSEFTTYGVLWVGVERLRQKKYNEYVKAHYILHQARYTPIRVRYIVKNMLYPPKQLLTMGVNYKNWQLNVWYNFFLCAKQKKYQLTLYNLQSTADTHTAPSIYKFDNQSLFLFYQNTCNYLNTYIWNSINGYQKLNSCLFRSLVYIPIIWNLNKAFVNDIYQFPDQSRLDLIEGSDYIFAHGLDSDVYDRLIDKQLEIVKKQAMGQFIIQDSVQDYFITHDLVKCVKTSQQLVTNTYSHLFDSATVNLLISNGIFDRYLATRLYSNQTRSILEKVIDQIHFIDNTYVVNYIRDYILCGSFYKLPGYISKIMGVMSYFYWRSYNTDGIHQAYKGRLHLYHYMKILNIQVLLFQQIYNIYKLILHIWGIYKINATSVGFSQIWSYMAVNYINWLHEYSYLTFFCLFKNSKININIDYYQQLYMNKPYTNFLSHIAVRRYLHNYLNIWSRLRRAPFDQGRGTCIHGKNPDRLQQWLVHVNWMRIIGLSRAQLPFYLYPESKPEIMVGDDFDHDNQEQETRDYLQELIKKTSHHHVNIYSCDLFIIYKQTDCVRPIQFKPYIKITNMLYDHSTS